MRLSRRSVLAGTTSAALAAAAPRATGAGGARTTLRMEPGQIEVAGKAARRYRVAQASGAFGLTLNEGNEFNVRLENGLAVLAGLHWHGLTEPWRQDGVPYLSGPPIAPGAARDYNFAAMPPGTRWMHSHFGLQEQNLLAAPLIIREASAIRSGAQEVVLVRDTSIHLLTGTWGDGGVARPGADVLRRGLDARPKCDRWPGPQQSGRREPPPPHR